MKLALLGKPSTLKTGMGYESWQTGIPFTTTCSKSMKSEVTPQSMSLLSKSFTALSVDSISSRIGTRGHSNCIALWGFAFLGCLTGQATHRFDWNDWGVNQVGGCIYGFD